MRSPLAGPPISPYGIVLLLMPCADASLTCVMLRRRCPHSGGVQGQVMFGARDKCHTIFVQMHSTGYNQPLDVSHFRAFKGFDATSCGRRRGHRMSSIEPIPKDTCRSMCQSSSSISLFWSMQPCISSATEAISLGWKDGSICCQTVKKSSWTCSKLPNVLHAKDGLFVDEKPSAPPGDETDAEDFAIWEDDDVAEEQEQADEVAEEPVFAFDGSTSCGGGAASRGATRTCHVQLTRSSPGVRQCVCKGPCSCKRASVDDRGSTSTCRRVHAASAHLPDDYRRARSTDGVRQLSASERRRSDLYQEEEGSVLLTA